MINQNWKCFSCSKPWNPPILQYWNNQLNPGEDFCRLYQADLPQHLAPLLLPLHLPPYFLRDSLLADFYHILHAPLGIEPSSCFRELWINVQINMTTFSTKPRTSLPLVSKVWLFDFVNRDRYHSKSVWPYIAWWSSQSHVVGPVKPHQLFFNSRDKQDLVSWAVLLLSVVAASGSLSMKPAIILETFLMYSISLFSWRSCWCYHCPQFTDLEYSIGNWDYQARKINISRIQWFFPRRSWFLFTFKF